MGSWWQELAPTGCVVSAVKKQREVKPGVSLLSPLYSVQEPSLDPPRPQWVFPTSEFSGKILWTYPEVYFDSKSTQVDKKDQPSQTYPATLCLVLITESSMLVLAMECYCGSV